MKNSEYVLWLCSWYPNKLSPLEGDFIQRHAQAVSKYKKVVVLCICHDADGQFTNDILLEQNENGQLQETIIYYRAASINGKWTDKFLAMRKFLKIGKGFIADFIAKNGKPNFIHTHIIMNMGMLANWAFHKYGIPYVLSEQWAAYLPEAKPNYNDYNFWSKGQWQKITTQAKGISVVSEYLGSCIKALNPVVKTVRIPNVVDGSIFYPAQAAGIRHGVTRFIHVSTAVYQKNVEAIVAAAAIVYNKQIPFELWVIVPEKMAQNDLFKQPFIKLLPERPQPGLAMLFKDCDAFILYSRYETFGCVVIEANAAGLPVIASDIPALLEIVDDTHNGLVVKQDNPQELAKAMENFIANKFLFNQQQIVAAAVERFSYDRVAQEFLAFYTSTLGVATNSL